MAAGISPIPCIAALTMRAGVGPCHVGGADIAPTNRALPIPPPTPPKPPSPPPRPFGATSPTNFGVSAAAKPAALAPASDAGLLALIPAWAAIMIGDIAMLAGYIAIWATCDICEIGADEANADTWDTAGATAEVTGDSADVNALPPDPANPVTPESTPLSGVAANNPVRPDRLNDGRLNDGNAAATAAAPP